MQKHLTTQRYGLSFLWQRPSWNAQLKAAVFFILLMTGLVGPAAATAFYKEFVIANNNYYYTNNNTGGKPNFQGADLGTFDRGTGRLLLGGEANTYSTNGDNVYAPQMLYRVYLTTASQSTINATPYTPLNLNYQSSGDDGNANNIKWSNTTTNSNLLDATAGAGTYTLEVFFQTRVTYDNAGGSGSFMIFDGNNGSNYKATFRVTGTQPVAWNGSINDNWFDARNWTPNTVPTATTDAFIPYTDNAQYYPTIRSGTAYVRTLSIQGNNGTIGAHNFIAGGELQVFGDFRDPNGGFSQTGGIFTLAGTSQTFDGASFFEVHIQGGGTKTLTNSMDILTNLAFVGGGGILATRTDNSTTYKVDLGANAKISGESDNNYVLGFLRARTLNVAAGATSTFGDIGLDLTPTTGNTGSTLVTRRTGASNAGVGSKQISIARTFAVQPDNPDNLNYTLTLRYLNTELNNNSAANLMLFRSVNGTNAFESLSRTSYTSNTVTRTAISGTLATSFTLAEVTPLPVTLTSFIATPTAQGNALLRWTTAHESDNKGFGIERQLGNSDAWQSVGYVATTNHTNGSTYEYTDKSLATAPTTPNAYYRLRQEDLDGKVSYSPVAAVARTAAAAVTELVLSPVPVSGGNLSLTFAEAGQAGSEVTIINTQGKRLLHLTTEASATEAVQLPVEQLASGVYIVQVQVPGQAIRHARFVKL